MTKEPTFLLKSFRIYNDVTTASITIDGVGDIEANVQLSKELLEQIKQESIESIRKTMLAKFEKKSVVVEAVNFAEGHNKKGKNND